MTARWRIREGLFCLALAVGVVQAQSVLEFPALGLLDTEEGTLEFRVRLGYDRSDDVGRDGHYVGMGNFWDFYYGDALYPKDNWSLSFYAGKWGTGAGVRLGKAFEGQKVSAPFFPSFGQDQPAEARPHRGGWYNLAIVWREGRVVTTYADGQPSAGRTYPGSIARLPTPSARMRLLPGPYALEYLRLSSVARAPEALARGPEAPVADTATLLLLDFRNARPEETAVTPTHAATAEAAVPVSLGAPFQLRSSPGGVALYAAPPASFGD